MLSKYSAFLQKIQIFKSEQPIEFKDALESVSNINTEVDILELANYLSSEELFLSYTHN